LLAPYRTQLAEKLDDKTSTASGTLPLDGTERVQESALGDVVADAFLAKYAAAGAQVAITNGAGLRDALPSSYAPSDMTLRRPAAGYAAGPPYDLVVGDVYSVLPFGDFLVLRPVTGALLWQVLEQSVFDEPSANNGFLQVAGLEFTYQLSAPAGARVQSVTLDDGTVVTRDDPTTYMLVDTSYLDTGGDDYGMLVETPAATGRDVDAQALLEYLQANPQVTPALAGRITQVP
jgi:5'-nucleotidase